MRTAFTAFLVVASDALLVTLSNGGLGCALFWRFVFTRYFARWSAVPVSPIGLGLFSPFGMFVALVELLVFSPLFWFGLTRTFSAAQRHPQAGE